MSSHACTHRGIVLSSPASGASASPDSCRRRLSVMDAVALPHDGIDLTNVLNIDTSQSWAMTGEPRAVILSDDDTLAVDETWLRWEPAQNSARTRALDIALVMQ